MSFRYGFVGYLIKAKKTTDGSSPVPNLDENGDPIPASNSQNGSSGNAIEFKCDYQPSVTTPLFTNGGTFYRISCRLFLDKRSEIKDANGNVVIIEKGDSI